MSESATVRVAVVGDLHIGAPVKQCDLSENGEDLLSIALRATEQLIESVSAARPDAVLITGDLFDRSDSSERALHLAQHMLDEWCEHDRPVAVISGNHDAESSLPARLRLPNSAHWFSDQAPETLMLPKLGVAVHGVSVLQRDDLRQVFDAFPNPVHGAFNIAMLHSSLDGEWSNRPCLPVPLERLRDDRRYEAWALGHVHRRLILNHDPLIFYPGGVHARRDDETGARGFAMLEIETISETGAYQRQAKVTELDFHSV